MVLGTAFFDDHLSQSFDWSYLRQEMYLNGTVINLESAYMPQGSKKKELALRAFRDVVLEPQSIVSVPVTAVCNDTQLAVQDRFTDGSANQSLPIQKQWGTAIAVNLHNSISVSAVCRDTEKAVLNGFIDGPLHQGLSI